MCHISIQYLDNQKYWARLSTACQCTALQVKEFQGAVRLSVAKRGLTRSKLRGGVWFGSAWHSKVRILWQSRARYGPAGLVKAWCGKINQSIMVLQCTARHVSAMLGKVWYGFHGTVRFGVSVLSPAWRGMVRYG